MSGPPALRPTATRYSLVEEGSVRMAPLLKAPGLLEEMGVHPEAVIAAAGLDAALFEDPENSIAFADGGRFLALCAERTGCRHFGLLTGSRLGVDVSGVVGQLVSSSPDLATQLRRVLRRMLIGSACQPETCLGPIANCLSRNANRGLGRYGKIWVIKYEITGSVAKSVGARRHEFG